MNMYDGQIVKNIARAQGFSFCGISRAEKLETEAAQLEAWLHKGSHGSMQYMENHFDKRIDPTLLVPSAKSVITCMFNYYPEKELSKSTFKISKYAYGLDYHDVLKEKLRHMLSDLQNSIGAFTARVFTDSAPVLEKAWALRSGLGWQGKNTNIIHPKAGSFYFLAEIICDVPFTTDGPIRDHCGTCTACVDACPTDALHTPYLIDASKCISYLTIELRDAIPDAFAGKMDNWIYGCDICQDVCPWNRFSKAHNEPKFDPKKQLTEMRDSDWMEITEDVFRELFNKTAVTRTKFEGLKRNINFLRGH